MKRNYAKLLLAAAAFVGLGLQQAWADKVATSTAEAPKWFRIFTPNRENLTVTSYGLGNAVRHTKTFESPYSMGQLWRFEAGSAEGKYKIVSMNGDYISPSSLDNNSPKRFITVASGAGEWEIKAISGKDDLYTIVSGGNQFNTSQDAPNYNLYNWGSGSNTTDPGCQYRFNEVTLSDLEVAQCEAQNWLTTTTEGNNPGEYTTESRTTLSNAIKSATDKEALDKAVEAYKASMVNVQAGKTYYIMSNLSKDYCQGKYIYSAGSEAQPKWGDKLVSAAYGWTFESAGDEGKFYVKNYATKEYIEPNNGNSTTGATITKKTASTKYTVKSLGQGVFNIIPDGKDPLHAQQVDAVLVTWAGGIGSASAWKLIEISDDELKAAPSVESINVQPGTQTYAPGKTDQVLLTFVTNVTGFNGNVTGKGVKLNLGATNFADLKNLKVYTSKNNLFISKDKRDATVVGTLPTAESNEVTIPFSNDLAMASGQMRFYVTADIAENAKVGNKVDAALVAFNYGDNEAFNSTQNGNPEGTAVIYKVQSVPYMPYDEGSAYWRIPSMVILRHQKDASKNGRVVTMADNRFNHGGDLPNHIDVYERHSDDNGNTWSNHKLVVGTDEHHKLVAGKNGGHTGFGDVTMVETANGKIIALMVGGQGYFSSTNEDQNRIVPLIITSDDAGETWSEPRVLTDELYKNTTYNEGNVIGSFAGSGRGLLLQRQKDAKRNGRVMFAMSHRFESKAIHEYIIYSDDEGATWQFSKNSAYSGGDESKLVETADGTVMISVRQSGQRGYNTSNDGGVTWGTQAKWADINGNACNGDILYVNKQVMLHSYINNGSRKNVTIKASFDQGKTWSNPFVVCAPSSCYSTMDVTKDGDIAIFYEDNACTQGYALNYAVLPTSFIYEGDLAQKALDAAVANANKAIEGAEAYEVISEAKAGQYAKAELDNLKALIEKAGNTTGMTDDDKYALSTEIENTLKATLATACTVDGYSNLTTFTISSFETSKYIGKDATATDADDYEWQIAPSTTTAGLVYIKGKDEANYLNRNGNTLTASKNAQAWAIQKGDGAYWHLKSTVNGSSYLVINVNEHTFNYWNVTAGNATWSTKFVLTAKGEVTAIDAATVVTPAAQAEVRYYDLQGRRVLNPTKGIFITNTGKKVIK